MNNSKGILAGIGMFLIFILFAVMSAWFDAKAIKQNNFWDYLFICTWEFGFAVGGLLIGLSLRL